MLLGLRFVAVPEEINGNKSMALLKKLSEGCLFTWNKAVTDGEMSKACLCRPFFIKPKLPRNPSNQELNKQMTVKKIDIKF